MNSKMDIPSVLKKLQPLKILKVNNQINILNN